MRAALSWFLEQGVVDTTIDDILIRSGASVGSFYHHFAGKDAVADALFTDCVTAYHEAAHKVLAGALSLEAGIRGIVVHHLTWVTEHSDQARFILGYREHELRPASEHLSQSNRDFFELLEHWLCERLPQARTLSLPSIIAVWLGPAQEYARHWLAGHSKQSPLQVAQALADATWSAMTTIIHIPESTPQ